MNSTHIRKIILVTAIVIPATLAYTETITLKNGTTIKGSLVEMTETDATIETADLGKIQIKRRAIQSIADGVEPTSVVPAVQQQTSANPLVINNNNNNQPTASLTPAPAHSEDKPPVTTTNVAAAPARSEGFSAQIDGGFSFLRTEAMIDSYEFGRSTQSNDTQGPSVHIVPLRYHLGAGFSAEIVADGLHHQQEQTGKSVQLLHLGGGLGWSSGTSDTDAGGGSWSAHVTYGYGELKTKGERNFTFDDESSPAHTYTGEILGANIGYTYYNTAGNGLNVGASALTGTLTNQEHSKFYDGTSDEDINRRDILAYSGYVGFAKRF